MVRRLMPDVVHGQDLLKLPGSAMVREAAQRMRSRRVGAVLVIDADERLAGIFTERDMDVTRDS